jgi:hypothetical protein
MNAHCRGWTVVEDSMPDGSSGVSGDDDDAAAPLRARFLGLQAKDDALVAEFQVETGEVFETSLAPIVAEKLNLALSVWLRRRSLTPRW